MKNPTWQNPGQLFVAQVLYLTFNKLSCGFKDKLSNWNFSEYTSSKLATYETNDDLFGEVYEYLKQTSALLIQAKEELNDLIKRIANKDHNEAVEDLANKIKSWKNRDLTQEEKEREEKITNDNLILAKVEFLSRINNKDPTLIELTKNAEGLVHREPLPHQYSWQDVALSILNFPEEVVLDYEDCPYCGEKQIKLYFHSPRWTWATMCGVGGEMVFCPKCQLQTEFRETIRN